MTRDARRNRRVPYIGPIQVSWEERGERRYARGKCIDVSEGGLKLELPISIAPLTEILLSAERIKISGSARVRHVSRYGSRYLLGVELSYRVKSEILESEIEQASSIA